MRWWMVAGYGLSIVAHIGLAAGIGSIPKNRPRKVSIVKVFNAPAAKKKAAEEDKKPPPPPENKPKPPPPPKNTPPPPTNATPPPASPQAAMAALPDFGLSLGGGGGEGGIAIPVAGMGTANGGGANAAGGGSRGPTVEKKVKAAAPKPSEASDGCVEEPTKPKAISKVTPQYIGSAAHAANIEGVCKVEIRVGADGEVIDSRILQGIGHGMDEIVIAATKQWKFSPATRCGKPVESRHIVSMRFQLGD